jgi:hypothetical protein
VKALLFLGFCALLPAQDRGQPDRPQLVWQGQVDGAVILHLAGKRMSVEVSSGAPVQREKFHFSDALPEVRQNARLAVIQGRGYVHIVDQPTVDNQYTLSVAIEDRQPGGSFYSIELYWDTADNPFEHAEKTDHVSWAGRVGQDAIVSCHARTCVASGETGAPPGAGASGERFKFSHPLPDREIDVRLEEPDGRGEIRLIAQPRASNDYTARVEIRDPLPGSADYSFALVWDRESAKDGKASKNPAESAQAFEPVGRGLLWSGTVSGRVRVTLEGGASFSQAVAGAPVQGEYSEILRPLPERADLMPQIRKLAGRGQVAIVETPSEKNHYRLIFEIDDPGPGAAGYQIEVDW